MLRTLLIFITCLFSTFTITATAAYLPPAQANAGMVSTAQRYATQVGVDILKRGGNAIDAAVAVGYALAVVDPCCGNLGGGGFMTIHLANGKNYFINFREKAPAAIKPELFYDRKNNVDKKKAHVGYLAAGVPGTVMGLNTALQRFGTMTLAQVMEPAIKLARKGFVLDAFDAKVLRNKQKYFATQPNIAATFLHKNRPYRVGERLRQPDLARTLQRISVGGTTAFYQGPIAKTIVRASKKHGGVFSLQDFANYTAPVSRPLRCRYRGYEVITGTLPSSGVTVCEILTILRAYPLSTWGYHAARGIHYNVEAMRYAFADRNIYLGDPAFVKNPLQKLLSPRYAQSIRKKIKPNRAGNSQLLLQRHEKAQTTHYSIIDRNGNAVAATVTLNGYFGSKVIAGKTGFFLNDELDDFTLKFGQPNMFKLIQGKANLIAPNKRPLSAMSPTILLRNGQPILVLGAAGGPTIITSVVEAIEHFVDYQMDLNAAVNAPRFHMQWLPDKVYMEPRVFSPDTAALLRKMGYRLQPGSIYGTAYWGQMAAVGYDPKSKTYLGAADNRFPAAMASGVGAQRKSDPPMEIKESGNQQVNIKNWKSPYYGLY